MSKKEETSHEEPELPAPRTYTRSEPLGGVGRPSLSDVPRRLPDIGAPRRSDSRGESNPSADGDDSKKLIVGRGIVLTGEIRACDRLVVEGRVEATLADSRSIEIAESGLFKGSAQIDTAEISGRCEGDITVKQRLIVHRTGRVAGTIRYGELEIERGGILSGTVELLGGAASAEPPADQSESVSPATVGATVRGNGTGEATR